MKHGFCSALEDSRGGEEIDGWPGNPQGPAESHFCSSELLSETQVGGSCQLFHLESACCPSLADAGSSGAGSENMMSWNVERGRMLFRKAARVVEGAEQNHPVLTILSSLSLLCCWPPSICFLSSAYSALILK